IDVHHHLVAPRFLPLLRELDTLTPQQVEAMNPARALEAMDEGEVATAVNSATTPTSLPDARRIEFARENNEFFARLAADHEGRFGFFANLPLPHVEASLHEIAYAFDVLKADGVHMITSYGGDWLGNRAFAPVFDELHRRRAVVYTHPHAPQCCLRLLGETNLRDSAIEYGTDTTRAIANYVFTGTSRRCPDVRMIWSHAGGTMPFLIYRFLKAAAHPANRAFAPDGIVAELKRYYYDTAQASHAVLLTALRQVVGLDRAAFGSDYPWGRPAQNVQELEAAGVLSAAERSGIDYANILPLLPRFG
ncbi:MAG: amidohydrolase family protein, partial [Stellaceae bacterium]